MRRIDQNNPQLHDIALQVIDADQCDFSYTDESRRIVLAAASQLREPPSEDEMLIKIGETINTFEETQAYILSTIIVDGLNKLGSLEGLARLTEVIAQNPLFHQNGDLNKASIVTQEAGFEVEENNGFELAFATAIETLVTLRNQRANRVTDDSVEKTLGTIATDTFYSDETRLEAVKALGQIYSSTSQRILAGILEELVTTAVESVNSPQPKQLWVLAPATSKALRLQFEKGPVADEVIQLVNKIYSQSAAIADPVWKVVGAPSMQSLVSKMKGKSDGVVSEPYTGQSTAEELLETWYIEASTNRGIAALTELFADKDKMRLLQEAISQRSDVATAFLQDFDPLASILSEDHKPELRSLYKIASRVALKEESIESALRQHAIHVRSFNPLAFVLGASVVSWHLGKRNTDKNVATKIALISEVLGEFESALDRKPEEVAPLFLYALFNQRSKAAGKLLKNIIHAIKELQHHETLPTQMQSRMDAYLGYIDYPSKIATATTDKESYQNLVFSLWRPNLSYPFFAENSEFRHSLIAALRNPPEGVELGIAKKGISMSDSLEKAPALGIHNPYRLSIDTLSEVIKEREDFAAGIKDARRIAVFFTPHKFADHNGAKVASDDLIKNLIANGYRVLYFEPQTNNPLQELERIKKKIDRDVDCLVLSAHGGLSPEPSMLILDPKKSNPRITTGSLRYAFGVRNYAKAVVLSSCSMGWGENNSLLNEVENTLARGGVVVASMGIAGGFKELIYDEEGRVVGAKPSSSNQSVYVTDPEKKKERSAEARLIDSIFG